jgi:tetratricopeptide (TPR) repeat protein
MARNVMDLLPKDARTDRLLDWGLRALVVIILVLAAYLGYSYWTTTQQKELSSPEGRAIDNLRRMVLGSPGNVNARVKLAEALAYSGRLDESVEQFQAALKLDPETVAALSGLATIAMERKDYKSAESYWLKVIALLDTKSAATGDPRLEQAYYGIGVTYIDTKRYEEAVQALKEALRIKSSASDTHYMISVAYRELDYPDKQREELLITLAFDPNNAQANYDLGLLYLGDKDTATAAELFRIAVDNAPEGITLPQDELDKIEANGDAAERLAKAQSLASKDPAAALVQARIAAALDAGSVPAVRMVAQLWERQGEKERALNAWNRLLELAPTDQEAAKAIKRLGADAK